MKGMNKTAKVLLVCLLTICLGITALGLVAVGSAGWFLTRALERDPQKVSLVQQGLAALELPEGFEEARAARIAGFSMVVYNGSDGRSHIYLMQAPVKVTLDAVETRTQMRWFSDRDDRLEMAVVERRPCHIAGQESTLIISEGTDHQGESYRSASAWFMGRGGTVLVNISTPTDTWSDETVNAFIASLS